TKENYRGSAATLYLDQGISYSAESRSPPARRRRSFPALQPPAPGSAALSARGAALASSLPLPVSPLQPWPPPPPPPLAALGRLCPRTNCFRKAIPKRLRRSWKKEDDEELDETLSERLWGLTEMFPERVRSAAGATFDLSLFVAQKMYRFSRAALWIGTTSFMILVLPVVFETEKLQMEQQQQLQQRQVSPVPGPLASGGGARC
uniref:Mitochondrial import receptor subunit TOM22 homolog n=1 Tax=Ailuropoda melanoleuca TaxID=9646 RepID=A0A7N5P4C2_AILME